MKKTLVFTLILTLILSIATMVSAATAKVITEDQVAEEGKLIVTVDLGSAVRGGVIRVNYDETVLELNSIPKEIAEKNVRELGTAGSKGYLFVGNADTEVSTITLEFNVIGEVGSTSPVTVTGEDFTVGANNDAVEVTFPGEQTVTVVAKAGETDGEGTTTPEPGASDNQGTGSEAGTQKDNGTTPTRYPQTGINVAYVAGTVVLALVAGYVVTKRN